MNLVKHRDEILSVAGYILLLFWVITAFIQYSEGMYFTAFWFCYISVAFLALACFLRSSMMISFFVGTGLLFQTPWILDWTIWILFDFSVFQQGGFWEGLSMPFMIQSFIRHILTVPLAIFLLSLFPYKKIPLKLIWFWVLLVANYMLFSYILPYNQNLNCIHESCLIILRPFVTGIWYTLGWFVIIIGVTIISMLFVAQPLHKHILSKIYHKLNKQ